MLMEAPLVPEPARATEFIIPAKFRCVAAADRNRHSARLLWLHGAPML
jgi:hypothetical protein